MTGVTISNSRSEPLTGNQTGGRGILVGSTSQSQVGHATITDCTIMNYDKNGIDARGTGTTVTVTGTTVTGLGPTPVNGQNGIVIGAGTSATITTTRSAATNSPARTAGPTRFPTSRRRNRQSRQSSSIAGNTVTGNDYGIYNSSTGTTISGNTVQSNRFEGVWLDQGTATVSNNTINGNNIGVVYTSFVGNTADTQGTLLSNNIFNNCNSAEPLFPGAGRAGKPGATTTATATAHFNRIVGNFVGFDNTTTTRRTPR